ncbi:MAG: hypothetical protein AAGA75_15565 [Cyanobacteria bacterium P01_E01_bin.6]
MLTPQWKASSILCLEDTQARLYVELIQLLPESGGASKAMAWLRPFAIQLEDSDVPIELQEYGDRLPDVDAMIFDARHTADLIWPIHLFRPGFDTEVIGIMAMLPNFSSSDTVPPEKREASRYILNQFLHRIWLANKQEFPAAGEQSPSRRPSLTKD